MATDGPAPEQGVTPPVTEKPGFFARLKRKNPPPAEAKAPATPPKEAGPGKMGKVMAELKKKDQEFDGGLVSEFGEEDSKFIALQSDIDPGEKYIEKPKVGDQAFRDHLLVTSDGFKILRLKYGKYIEMPPQNRERFPDVDVIPDRDPQDKTFGDAMRMLIKRGNSSFQQINKGWERLYSTEGSGYTHENGIHKLNFGKGPSLEFNQYANNPSVASLDRPSPQLIAYLQEAAGRYGTTQDDKELLRRLRGGEAQLILNPNPDEIGEILQTNITEAKAAKDRRDVARLAAEAKKIADAKVAQQPERDRLAAEEAQRQNAAKRTTEQARAADAVLDLLGKL